MGEWLQGEVQRRKGMSRQGTHVGGTHNTLDDTTIMNIWHYTSVQIHGMDKTKSKSQHELWMLGHYGVSA